MKPLRAWHILLLVLPLVMVAGCNNKKPGAAAATNPPPPPTVGSTRPPIGNYVEAAGRLVPENDLREFAKLYMIAANDRPPRSLADMPDLKRDMHKAYPAFADGRYVVLWGADPNRAPAGASQSILAYEKRTPENGGVVVFLDGHTENVSAQDFPKYAKPGGR